VDLVEIAEGFAVVGDQRQVDGQALGVLAERLGQVPGERGVELSVQRGVIGQGGQQRLASRLVGGGVAEALAGVGQRGDAGGGGQQERPEDLGRDLAFVVLELEVGLQVLGGELVESLAVEDTMGSACYGSGRDGNLDYFFPEPNSGMIALQRNYGAAMELNSNYDSSQKITRDEQKLIDPQNGYSESAYFAFGRKPGFFEAIKKGI